MSSIQLFGKEFLILDKTKSINDVTFYKKNVIEAINACPMNVEIYEFFASDKLAHFNQDSSGDFIYVIVGELEIETDDSKIHARGGDIVSIPQKDNLVIKIYTIKYGKFIWAKCSK